MASDKCLYCGQTYNHGKGCPVGRFLGQDEDESEDVEPESDVETVYYTCPACNGRCEGCMICWDEGVVPLSL